jgi:hypothetical protein
MGEAIELLVLGVESASRKQHDVVTKTGVARVARGRCSRPNEAKGSC